MLNPLTLKPLERQLEPIGIDKDQWQKRVIVRRLQTTDGEEITPPIEVLTSQPSQGNVLDFEFKSDAIRPTELIFPVWVSSNAKLELFVNTRPVRTFDLVSSVDSTPLVHCLQMDITPHTEQSEVSRMRMRVSFQEGEGTTTIVTNHDQAGCRLMVSQRWAWRYGLQSLAFFILSWGAILGFAVIVLAHLKPLGNTFRFYAVTIAVITWVISALGLPDLANIPLRALVRRVYSKTHPDLIASGEGLDETPNWKFYCRLKRNRRILSLAFISLFFILVTSGSAVIVYCMAVHQYYAMLIQKALKEAKPDETIRRAFILEPWRKEAQLLFERRAWGLRNQLSMADYRKHIQKFTLPDIEQVAVEASPRNDLSISLDRNNDNSLNDPLVWYASILPEGEEQNEDVLMNKAILLLSQRTDPEGRMQRISLALEQAGVQQNDELAKKLLSELDGLLTTGNDIESIVTLHSYQVACDTLAANYIVLQCDVENAYKWYQREIEARRRQQTPRGEPLWQRPPEKLTLYYMFRSYGDMGALDVYPINNAKELLDYCEPSATFRPIFENRLLKSYPDYKKETPWLKGTIFDDKFESFVNTLLENGWRY